MKRILVALTLIISLVIKAHAQQNVAPTPPMGFMTWNFFADNITEADVKSIADAMVTTGLKDAGYIYIFIDDGWQGGRDNKNNTIPDPKKFPSGMKALCDYVHGKGLKIGIYSDAAQLTCGGYTASINFEEQDAKTFAGWGFDYLKYDYCGAPEDRETAIKRYKQMYDALQNSGRLITFSVCEWGNRQPWLWAKATGGNLWRTTADIRDKWKSSTPPQQPNDLHRLGAGIMDVVNINAELYAYAGPNGWNDADMLNVGLYGKKGPSGDLGGKGCTDTEYQSQMSLWCLMAAPLMISCDIRNMNEATKNILLNKDVIAIDQDSIGKQAQRIINNETWQVFVKSLANGDYAVGILNVSETKQDAKIDLSEIGITGTTQGIDLWSKQVIKLKSIIKVSVAPHETKLFRLSK